MIFVSRNLLVNLVGGHIIFHDPLFFNCNLRFKSLGGGHHTKMKPTEDIRSPNDWKWISKKKTKIYTAFISDFREQCRSNSFLVAKFEYLATRDPNNFSNIFTTFNLELQILKIPYLVHLAHPIDISQFISKGIPFQQKIDIYDDLYKVDIDVILAGQFDNSFKFSRMDCKIDTTFTE